MPIDLTSLTIASAHDALVRGDFTALQLAEAYLNNIEAKNKELNAYLEVYDDVREQANKADELMKQGRAGMMTGIPIALKDNILMLGKRVTASSKILEGYVAPYEGLPVSRLRAQGAVVLGRTNMDEFAMGSSTETSAFGPSRNPFDTTRTPGGSSGGATAAVGGDLALASLGTDTAGSVRLPAAFCNTVGSKPTYGSISRNGIIAMGSSLDIIGPITKTVEDAEIMFNTIRGRDPFDSTSIDIEAKSYKLKANSLSVGIPRNFLEMEGIDADVLANFNAGIKKLQARGHTIVDITLPTIPHSLAVYYVVMPAELSTNLSRFDGVRYGFHKDTNTLLRDYAETRAEGFGMEARRRILLGAYVLSSGYYDAYYRKAIQVRTLIEREFAEAFKKVDLIATPTTATPAFKLDEKSKNPLSMYLTDIFTVPANIGAIPAISIPSGFVERDGKKLPLGFQLMAGYGNDWLLFEVGKQFTNECDSPL